MNDDISAYARQGFGAAMAPKPPYGLLIVDLVNGFADPAVFGGGNIAPAIAQTTHLLAHARSQGWPVAHSRIVFADDDADHNIFTLKVPGMLTLKETHPNSAIVPQLAPAAGELVVRKTVPSAFFGTSPGRLAVAARCPRRCWWRARSPAAACGQAWWTRCSTAFGRWWCRTAWATAPSARTRPTCSTCARSTLPC